MIKRLSALALASLVGISAAHAAEQKTGPKAGDIAVFITDPFNSNQVGGMNLSTTTYNIGGFVIDDLMIYGGFRVLRASGDNTIGLNAGARYYIDFFKNSPVRTFIDGNLSVTDAELSVSGIAADARLISMGAFAGAEYLFTPNISLAARIGLTVTDVNTEANNADGDTTVSNIGATDVTLNIYF